MAESNVAKTASLLMNTDQMIEEIKQLRDDILPQHSAILTQKIHVTKRSANSLFLTAHVSLRDKIAYEQQRRAVFRQKTILTEIENHKEKWSVVLEKAKEQKRQLRRLQRVQQEYEIISRLSNCNEDCKKDLKKRIVVAMDRSMRAQRTYREIVQQVQAIAERMQEDSAWHQKQDELDERAINRAREAATKKGEARAKAEAEDWPPAIYKAKGKRNSKCQNSKARGKAQH